MWIVCITSVRHVLTVNGYGGRQTKENEKSWCFKGWETLVNNKISMAELKATVCLQGKDIEVISSHIEFNRKTDNKGRPVTNVIGGRITITVESTRETTILEAMVNCPFKAISGKVIYYNTKDNSIFRVVEFKYAYIVYYKEIYNVDRKRQMYSTITFSADIIMIGDAYLSNQW